MLVEVLEMDILACTSASTSAILTSKQRAIFLVFCFVVMAHGLPSPAVVVIEILLLPFQWSVEVIIVIEVFSKDFLRLIIILLIIIMQLTPSLLHDVLVSATAFQCNQLAHAGSSCG